MINFDSFGSMITAEKRHALVPVYTNKFNPLKLITQFRIMDACFAQKRILLLVVYCCLMPFIALSQEIEWQKTFGGSGFDNLYTIQQTYEGGYIMGGYSSSGISGDKTENTLGSWDYWIIKTDALGNIQWQNTIGGNGEDYLYSMRQTMDGGYILGGYSNSNISGDKTENTNGGEDYWIIKTDASGNIEWQNTIGGSGSDILYSLSPTADGGYILGGYSDSNISGDKTEDGKGGWDYWIVKTDSLGTVQWEKTIGGASNDDLQTIEQTWDGGYILGGSSESDISGDKTENNRGGSDYWMVKTDSVGTVLWDRTIGGNSYDPLSSLAQTMDGGYILGGWSSSNISGEKSEDSMGGNDYWVVKTDSLGSIQWQNTIGGSSTDYLNALQPTDDGGFILGGHSLSDATGDKTENSNGVWDYWIIKIDSVGSIVWQNTIGGNLPDWLYALQQTNDGGYVLGGYSASGISGDKTEISRGGDDYWIIKITPTFNVVKGKMFVDSNSNSNHDFGEPVLVNHKVTEVNTGRFAFSHTDGTYVLSVLDSGNYIANPAPLPYYTSAPLQHNVYFSGINQADSLMDFAFQPMSSINDLLVTLTPTTPFRPGFDAHYSIHYKNVGTNSLSPIVVFYPDAGISFVSSPIIPALITPDSVVWQLTQLNPYQAGVIPMAVNVSPAMMLGSIVNSVAKIEPIAGDADANNNQAWWSVTVSGSYDPNDVLVNKNTILLPDVPSQPFLEYIIRFQNTGTDTAFTVNVSNSLPQKTVLSTFEFIESSHPVQLRYLSSTQEMWFEFNNILLPDSNINETASHGYLRYRIKPNSTLVVNDTIKNFAAIYFDFNAPVITNTATTVVVLPTSNAALIPASQKALHIFPNPSSEHITIRGAINGIRILDIYGMSRYESSARNRQLEVMVDVSHLTDGIYIIESGSERVKFVKQ